MPVTYICENEHERDKHKSQPAGHGQKPVCVECSAEIIERRVPLFECEDCEHRWYYTGDADRPSCAQCRGKAVQQVSTA